MGGDPHVAFFSPISAPLVPEDVELFAILRAVANEVDWVVGLSRATLLIEDSRLIEGQLVAITINDGRDWLLGDGSLDGILVASLNVGEELDIDAFLGQGVVEALALNWVLRVVWIEGSIDGGVLLVVLIGHIHVASSAAIVVTAVNQLLVRELEELSSCDVVSTLKSADNTEGPGGAAGSLVPDWIDSHVSPVNRVWQLCEHSRGGNLLSLSLWEDASPEAGHLSLRHV